jgi:hypothetical protein
MQVFKDLKNMAEKEGLHLKMDFIHPPKVFFDLKIDSPPLCLNEDV